MGLSITLKSWSGIAQVAVGGRSSVVRAPAAKADHGFDSQWLPDVLIRNHTKVITFLACVLLE